MIQPKILPWYWKWLGFSLDYQAKVLGDPIQEGEDWKYNLELVSYRYRWLWFTLKTIKL